jgi:hypothetical protein
VRVALFILTWALSTAAQTLIDVIPRSQPPEVRVFPPKESERTAPGTGKFVLFTREKVGASNEWDFVAGAWECIPDRPQVPITRRIRFPHAPGQPEPLLQYPVDRRSRDQFPRWVKLRVPREDSRAQTFLYDINYRTWETRCVWAGTNLWWAFGIFQNQIVCKGPGGWRALNPHAGTWVEGSSVLPLGADGSHWLVRRSPDASEVWSFQPETGRFVGQFKDPGVDMIREDLWKLSPDGEWLAWLEVQFPANLAPPWWVRTLEKFGIDPPAWEAFRQVPGHVVVRHAGRESDLPLPVTLLASTRRGSFEEHHLEFLGGDALEFSAIQSGNAPQEAVWRLDLKTGKVSRTERPLVTRQDAELAVFDGVPTPAYLRRHLLNFRHFGRDGMAPAFLRYKGILGADPQYADCVAGVSPDGRHILYHAKSGPLSEEFIYGDLLTQQVVRWPRPQDLAADDAMTFVWVETP